MDYFFADTMAKRVEACDNRRELALLIFARSLSSRWPLFWHKNQCRLYQQAWISAEEKRAFGQSPEDVPEPVAHQHGPHENTGSLSHADPCSQNKSLLLILDHFDQSYPLGPALHIPCPKRLLIDMQNKELASLMG